MAAKDLATAHDEKTGLKHRGASGESLPVPVFSCYSGCELRVSLSTATIPRLFFPCFTGTDRKKRRRRAHEMLGEGGVLGKIVLLPNG